jgi:hypothetical protein
MEGGNAVIIAAIPSNERRPFAKILHGGAPGAFKGPPALALVYSHEDDVVRETRRKIYGSNRCDHRHYPQSIHAEAV